MNYYIELFLQILIILAAGGIFYLLYEAKNTQITRTNIHSDKLKKGDTIKIVHLSDIHIDILKQNTQLTKRMISKENPDLILLSGDYINTPKTINSFIAWMLNVQPEGTPIYGCLGNHDIHAFSSLSRKDEKLENLSGTTALEQLDFIDSKGLNEFVERMNSYGINILDNANTCVTIDSSNSTHINIVGIGEFRYFLSNYDKAFDGIDTNALNIVLGHNPDMVFNLPPEKSDLFLCGHFHGGQIRLPFNLEYKVFRTEKLCREGYTRGLHVINKINTYINRGIGCVLLPFRFLSRPEIAVITISNNK